MPAANRAGHEGRRVEWPWSDRGRSAVTRDGVLRDLHRVHELVAQVLVGATKDQATVIAGGKLWH